MEFRTLRADEIDLRVGTVGDGYYTLLLYKDARCDMNILDETVGNQNWQRNHKEVKGNLYCSVGINCAFIKDNEIINNWVWKEDCGVESNTEKEKGEASDSFKRACVNWGIGRELYTSPNVYVNCETLAEKDDKGRTKYKIKNFEDIKRSNSMKVKEIEYNDKREITKLIIVDSKGVQVYPKAERTEEQKKALAEAVVTTSSYRQEIHCVECDDSVSQKVADYSIQKYGKVLCYNCQKFKEKGE